MAKVTQAHIDARTAAILDAAIGMFVRKGVDGATMQEIAAEAGLSAGAIYRYFASKEDLLRAVCASALERARAMFQQASAVADSPVETLVTIGRSAWEEMKQADAREDAILFLEAILAAARKPEELAASRREMWQALIELLGGLLRQAQAAGEIDPQVDAEALALTVLACHLGTHVMALELGDKMDTDAVFEILMRLVRGSAPQARQPVKQGA